MITSVSNKRMKHLLLLQEKSRARNTEGLFIAEGIRMFEEAPLEKLEEIYVSEAFCRQMGAETDAAALVREKLHSCVKKGIHVEQVSEEVFRKISDTQTPQGILFVTEQLSWSLKEMAENALERQRAGGRPGLFLLLEDIQDPGNLGTMLRTGEGAGADGVIMSKGTVDIYNPKTIRSTMGSLYRVPFVYVEELGSAIELFRQKGIRIYAAHLQGEQYFDRITYESGSAFLVGNEGNGLRQETAERADIWLKIPMEGRLESLNAAVAASLLLYRAAGDFRRSF